MGDFFMNSFWIENFKAKDYPSLKENLNTDACIIGGGITGISCGYYLSKNNLKVCILEKDKIMQKTSGHTTAKITSQHGLFYKYLYDSYGKDTAKKYLESNEEAISNIKNIIDLENIDCDFEYQNHYVYTTDANNIKKIGSVNIDLKMILKNHDGFYNGKYQPIEDIDDYTTHDDSDWLIEIEKKSKKELGIEV
jgi:hypothetical protein